MGIEKVEEHFSLTGIVYNHNNTSNKISILEKAKKALGQIVSNPQFFRKAYVES